MKCLNICRCCLSQNSFKDIENEYCNGQQKEVYSEMLLKTFNIKLSLRDNIRNLICEECISRLRDAASFKKQVLRVEETICLKLKELEDGVDFGLGGSPKLESVDDFMDHVSDFDDKISDHFNDEFSWEGEELKSQNEGDIYVIKLEPRENDPSLKQTTEEVNTDVTEKGTKVTIRPNAVMTKKVSKIVKAKSKVIQPSKRKLRTPISQTQIDMRENSLKLILNSNMCLFNSLKTKYQCFNCKESFMEITGLREHAKTHSNIQDLAIRVNRLKGLSFKNVDISSLVCKICSEPSNDLVTLREHLIMEHGLKFGNAEHLLIPYKLENGFQCVICKDIFNSYLRLSIHMNSHYRNNVCEICGVSYINRMSLRIHVHSMHREKKCSLCSATFITNYSRVKHMKKFHNAAASKRHCLLCNQTFRYTYQLVEHKIQEHGAKRPICNCIQCGKTFLTPQNLRIHIRSVHVRERNHPCSVCDVRFFTKCDQKRHERTHEDVKSFSCSYCEGRFKTKDSWRRHLKRQHGHSFEQQ